MISAEDAFMSVDRQDMINLCNAIIRISML